MMDMIKEIFGKTALEIEADQQKKWKRPSDKEVLQHIHEEGRKRFGSECKHENVRNNICTHCLRKVIS